MKPISLLHPYNRSLPASPSPSRRTPPQTLSCPGCSRTRPPPRPRQGTISCGLKGTVIKVAPPPLQVFMMLDKMGRPGFGAARSHSYGGAISAGVCLRYPAARWRPTLPTRTHRTPPSDKYCVTANNQGATSGRSLSCCHRWTGQTPRGAAPRGKGPSGNARGHGSDAPGRNAPSRTTPLWASFVPGLRNSRGSRRRCIAKGESGPLSTPSLESSDYARAVSPLSGAGSSAGRTPCPDDAF